MEALNIVLTVGVVVLLYASWKYMFVDPYTLQTTQNARFASTIDPSSLATNGPGVPPTNFAYSMWFYVNDWNYRYGEPKVLFGRMGAASLTATDGSIPNIPGVDPCPVLYLGAMENNLSCAIACFAEDKTRANTVVHTCSVHDVPIQRWVHVVASVYNRTLDLYLDGKLVRTCVLPGIAKINPKATIEVTPSGGFDGWTANFQFYPNPLNPQQVWSMYTRGYSQWTSVLNAYKLNIALVENGTTQTSISL